MTDEDKSPNLKIAGKKLKKPPTPKLQRKTEKQINPGLVSQNNTQNIPDNKSGNNTGYEANAPKKLIIKGDMTINQLKNTFKTLSNFTIRIYSGKQFADGDATLFSVGYNQPNPIKLKLNDRMTVDNFEKAFKEKLGISIQVENQQGKLADNSLLLFQL